MNPRKRLVIVCIVGVVSALIVASWKFGAPSNHDGDRPPSSSPIVTLDRSPAPAERLLDPQRGGWEEEAFSEAIAAQLDHLEEAIASGSLDSASELLKVVTPDIRTSPLFPSETETVFRTDTLTIERQAEDTAAPEYSIEGVPPFAEALRQFRAALQNGNSDGEMEIALKLIAVKSPGPEKKAETTVLLRAESRAPSAIARHHATWECVWTQENTAAPPLLSAVRASRGETVRSQSRQPWFSDRSQAALGANASFAREIGHGMHHWLQRVGRVHGMLYFQRHGIAVGDADGDGFDDVYLCQPAGLPNKLLIRQPDGSAADVSAEFGVDWLDHTASALFVDLDNDGDQDLALATFEGTLLLDNQAGEGFVRRALLPSPDNDLHALSAADFDNDGDLDLYVTVDFALSTERAFLYHDANDGGRNQLFRNNGAWGFTEATSETGLGTNNTRHSLAAAWEDYDNDGDQDLYVANDYGKNCLYRNDSGSFTEVAAETGVLDYGSGMSVSWGDCDRDGAMDLYVGNMFSSAGSRVTTQRQFLPRTRKEVRSLYTRFVRGNSFYLNLGDGSFAETSGASGAMRAGWAWSSVFADIDNDGWEDLFVANGYITTPDSGDL